MHKHLDDKPLIKLFIQTGSYSDRSY